MHWKGARYPLCDIPSGCFFFTGPWTVTRSSLRMLCRVAAFCRHCPHSCVTIRRVAVSLRGPGQSPVRPFACCVGSMLSDGRCGRCSLWCRFRVSGAQ